MDIEWAERFAVQWCADWNSHDLDRIMSHYAEDVRWASPVAAQLTRSPYLVGKAALRDYFAQGLQRLPGLRFVVESVRAGVDAVVIDYRNERGQAVSEVLTFQDGMVIAGFGAYARPGT